MNDPYFEEPTFRQVTVEFWTLVGAIYLTVMFFGIQGNL